MTHHQYYEMVEWLKDNKTTLTGKTATEIARRLYTEKNIAVATPKLADALTQAGIDTSRPRDHYTYKIKDLLEKLGQLEQRVARLEEKP